MSEVPLYGAFSALTPGNPVALYDSGNEYHFTNALTCLVKPNCVVIFVARC